MSKQDILKFSEEWFEKVKRGELSKSEFNEYRSKFNQLGNEKFGQDKSLWKSDLAQAYDRLRNNIVGYFGYHVSDYLESADEDISKIKKLSE